MSRLTVAMPKARDGRDRAPTIPASVLAKRAAAAAAAAGGAGSAMDVEGAGGLPTRKTEKDLMWENGGPGVYSCDYRKYYDLKARRGGMRLDGAWSHVVKAGMKECLAAEGGECFGFFFSIIQNLLILVLVLLYVVSFFFWEPVAGGCFSWSCT